MPPKYSNNRTDPIKILRQEKIFIKIHSNINKLAKTYESNRSYYRLGQVKERLALQG